ncbi:MAG: type II toxin-antitoxin system RelE/ParE family toxin [Limisphaerales bacterium]
MIAFSFHPEALLEYAEATNYYLAEAYPKVAESFLVAIESSIATILEDPELWRTVEEPGIRRFVVHRFPFVIYYRFEPETNRVTIYAVMHCSRKPGYWKNRVE